MQNRIKKQRERETHMVDSGVTSGERDLVFGFGEKPHKEREREYVTILVF